MGSDEMDKKLIQVKMPRKTYTEIEELQAATGLTTMTEVVKFSLALFKWTVDKQKDGYEIYAIPKDDKKSKGEKIQMLLPV